MCQSPCSVTPTNKIHMESLGHIRPYSMKIHEISRFHHVMHLLWTSQTPKQRFCIVGIRDVRGVRVDPGHQRLNNP